MDDTTSSLASKTWLIMRAEIPKGIPRHECVGETPTRSATIRQVANSSFRWTATSPLIFTNQIERYFMSGKQQSYVRSIPYRRYNIVTDRFGGADIWKNDKWIETVHASSRENAIEQAKYRISILINPYCSKCHQKLEIHDESGACPEKPSRDLQAP